MATAQSKARPARFDGTSQARRAMLAKIHIAKKDLALDEDDYRQILFDQAGVSSASDASHEGLEKVLRRFEGLGWKPVRKGAKPRPAQHPMAKKARALWISLYHLGEVRSPEEKSLEAFARRQLKCERLVWANQRHSFKLIEALKAMAERGGWSQTDASCKNLDVRSLQEGLCHAILAKLVAIGEVPDHWTLNQTAFRLCGIELGEVAISAEGYNELAAMLGKKLRDASAGAGGAK